MIARRLLWGLALWLALGALLGQPAQAQSIQLRRYAHDQGLLGFAGTCLLQTRAGTLWVCTESGLYRFNGQDFQQVPLQGERGHMISDVQESADAQMWVASSESLYVGSETSLRRLTAQETGPLKQNSLKLASPRWAMVVINGGQALQARPQAQGRWQLLPLFDAATLVRLPQLGKIVSAQAEGDVLWLGCGDALCRVGADRQVQVFDQRQGLPGDTWRSVLHDRQGNLWVRGERHLMQLPAGGARFIPRPVPGMALDMFSRQTQILMDRLGRVLLRTNTGLARWESDHWRTFDHRNGLPDGAIVALLFDQQGDLWMTVRSEGLVRWSGYDWIENWDATQGMSIPPTWSIQRDARGVVLLGNEGGVSRQPTPDAPFQPWLHAAGIQTVGLQITADGAVWTADSLGDLRRFDGDSRHGRLVSHVGGATKRMYLDRSGRLWILTMKGLYLLAQPLLGTDTAQRVQALPAAEYTDIQERANGSIWIAGASGIHQLQDGKWTLLRMQLDGKPAQAWVDKVLIREDGHVWASLWRPGLWQGQLQGDTLMLRQVDDVQFREAQVYLIRSDHAGRIWVGHSQGVDVYDGQRWSRLSQTQGLLWDDISEAAFFEDDDGSVWVGSAKGVSHVLDPRRLFDGATPALRLTELTRGGQAIQPGARLPWSEDPLHVEVAASGSYDDRNRVSLRYRFAGLHSKWISTPNFEIDHPPLPPGDYVFQIQLLDSYRRSTSPVTALAFSVAPVWWRSPPMLLLYVVLGLSLCLAALRWRERLLRQKQRMLADLVAQRTQELEHDKRELEKARSALAVKASHDALTGLPNRAGILEHLQAQIQTQQISGTPLAVAMIDLDHFKQVNDVHGHLVGDNVLSQVGQRLMAMLRGSDLIGRYGGEELLGVLPGLPKPSHERLQNLQAAIGGLPLCIGDVTLTVTASMGVSWHRPGETAELVISRADQAMYRAKHLGRNRVELEP